MSRAKGHNRDDSSTEDDSSDDDEYYLAPLLAARVIKSGKRMLTYTYRNKHKFAMDILSDGAIKAEGKTFDDFTEAAMYCKKKAEPKEKHRLVNLGWDRAIYMPTGESIQDIYDKLHAKKRKSQAKQAASKKSSSKKMKKSHKKYDVSSESDSTQSESEAKSRVSSKKSKKYMKISDDDSESERPKKSKKHKKRKHKDKKHKKSKKSKKLHDSHKAAVALARANGGVTYGASKLLSPVCLLDLVANGYVKPGRDVLYIEYAKQTFYIDLQADGKLIFKGDEYLTPSQCAKAVKDHVDPEVKKGPSGWKLIMIVDNNLPLDDARTEILADASYKRDEQVVSRINTWIRYKKAQQELKRTGKRNPRSATKKFSEKKKDPKKEKMDAAAAVKMELAREKERQRKERKKLEAEQKKEERRQKLAEAAAVRKAKAAAKKAQDSTTESDEGSDESEDTGPSIDKLMQTKFIRPGPLALYIRSDNKHFTLALSKDGEMTWKGVKKTDPDEMLLSMVAEDADINRSVVRQGGWNAIMDMKTNQSLKFLSEWMDSYRTVPSLPAPAPIPVESRPRKKPVAKKPVAKKPAVKAKARVVAKAKPKARTAQKKTTSTEKIRGGRRTQPTEMSSSESSQSSDELSESEDVDFMDADGVGASLLALASTAFSESTAQEQEQTTSRKKPQSIGSLKRQLDRGMSPTIQPPSRTASNDIKRSNSSNKRPKYNNDSKKIEQKVAPQVAGRPRKNPVARRGRGGAPKSLWTMKDPVALSNLTLMECEMYTKRNQPFSVRVSSNVRLVLDVHAHLNGDEIIGYFAGRYDADSQELQIVDAFPCKPNRQLTPTGEDVDVVLDVEMELADSLRLEALIKSRGMSVVGWYHSHPNFLNQPSVVDVCIQSHYTSVLKHHGDTKIEPFVGAIITPYARKHPKHYSETRWFVAHDANEDEPFRTPLELSVDILHEKTMPEDVVDRCVGLIAAYKFSPARMDFSAVYKGVKKPKRSAHFVPIREPMQRKKIYTLPLDVLPGTIKHESSATTFANIYKDGPFQKLFPNKSKAIINKTSPSAQASAVETSALAPAVSSFSSSSSSSSSATTSTDRNAMVDEDAPTPVESSADAKDEKKDTQSSETVDSMELAYEYKMVPKVPEFPQYVTNIEKFDCSVRRALSNNLTIDDANRIMTKIHNALAEWEQVDDSDCEIDVVYPELKSPEYSEMSDMESEVVEQPTTAVAPPAANNDQRMVDDDMNEEPEVKLRRLDDGTYVENPNASNDDVMDFGDEEEEDERTAADREANEAASGLFELLGAFGDNI